MANWGKDGDGNHIAGEGELIATAWGYGPGGVRKSHTTNYGWRVRRGAETIARGNSYWLRSAKAACEKYLAAERARMQGKS